MVDDETALKIRVPGPGYYGGYWFDEGGSHLVNDGPRIREEINAGDVELLQEVRLEDPISVNDLVGKDATFQSVQSPDISAGQAFTDPSGTTHTKGVIEAEAPLTTRITGSVTVTDDEQYVRWIEPDSDVNVASTADVTIKAGATVRLKHASPP